VIGDARAGQATKRAEFLLERRLLWRRADGALIQPEWAGPVDKVHHPIRFYDVLGALVVIWSGLVAGRADAPSCQRADQPICLADCTQEHSATTEATCRAGQWACPSGYQDSKTCPADACAVTDYECCDRITGEVTPNPCPPTGGLRPPCPEGTKRGDYWMCIPDSLDVFDCEDLSKKPCSGEAHACGSGPGGRVKCWCRMPTDAGAGIWECLPYLP
jgi:hypothetical protein